MSQTTPASQPAPKGPDKRPSQLRYIARLAAVGDISPAARAYTAGDYDAAPKNAPTDQRHQTYRCPECNAGNYRIRHRQLVQCDNRHFIRVYANAMYLWGKDDPPPEAKPRNADERAEMAAKQGDFLTAAIIHQREDEKNRGRPPQNPRRLRAPDDADTTHVNDCEVSYEEETYRCPRHPEHVLVLFHGEPQECPAGRHMIMLTGAVVRTWDLQKPKTPWREKMAALLGR